MGRFSVALLELSHRGTDDLICTDFAQRADARWPMISVSPVWQLGNIRKGPDVIAEKNLRSVRKKGHKTCVFSLHMVFSLLLHSAHSVHAALLRWRQGVHAGRGPHQLERRHALPHFLHCHLLLAQQGVRVPLQDVQVSRLVLIGLQFIFTLCFCEHDRCVRKLESTLSRPQRLAVMK